jgi:hypothetical protein
MYSESSGFIATCCDNSPPATASYNKRLSYELGVILAFNRYKKSIEIEMYNVPFHTSK